MDTPNTRPYRLRYPLLARRRDELGLTNASVAEAIGAKTSWWRGLLHGHCIADEEQVVRICEVLGVRPEDVPHVVVYRPAAVNE